MDTVKFDKKNAKIIAHRGLSGIECENTCEAFEAAGKRSYFGIETDVHVLADGLFYIFHDDTLTRMAGIDKNIEEMTAVELFDVRLTDPRNPSERTYGIPCLEEYIRICAQYRKIAVLELKNYMEPKDCAEILNIINELNYLDNTVFISFSRENCVEIRRILPDAKIQFLKGHWEDGLLDWLKEHRLDLDISHTEVTRELVELIHANGLEINVWTVDDKARAEELADFGVDYITTNILE